MMFKKELRKLLGDIESLRRNISNLEGDIKRLEKKVTSLEPPAKYKIGEDLKYYVPSYCGESSFPIKVKVLSTYYSYTRMYTVFTGEQVIDVIESSLCKN